MRAVTSRPVRRPAVRIVLAVLVALALAACGDGKKSSESAPTSPGSTSTSRSTRSTPSAAAPAPPDLDNVHLSLTTVASGLDSPVAMAWRPGDDRLYVAEQGGKVRIVGADGRVLPTPVLTVAVSGGNEQGLLGLAFAPQDADKMYVDYTDPAGDTHVVEYTMKGDVADTSTRRELLFVDQPFPNHNGGQVVFGPDDMLYITFGDGGAGGDPMNNAPNLDVLLGKILRIDPRPSSSQPYRVPADNPFVDRQGVRTEIWMYGLRNPWRFSWDRDTRDIWIGDVGQDKFEEVDYAPAGQSGIDWGWSAREGFAPYKGEKPSGARDPLVAPSHADGNCAVIGGYVYRGREIPALDGIYVYGDSCRAPIVGVVQQAGKLVDQRDLDISVHDLSSFGEDPHGEVYAIARGGTISRIAGA